MLGYNLRNVYVELSGLGLVRSKRHFSRDYLGCGWSYLRDIEQRDRDEVRIPIRIVAALRERLRAVARLVPPQTRGDIERVIAHVDLAEEVVIRLGYGRGGR